MEHKKVPLPLGYPSTSDAAIWDLMLSVHYASAVTVSIELGVFTYLANKEMGETVENIAKDLSLSVKGVEPLVATVAALGYLRFVKGAFSLTELARNFLLPTSPYSWVPILLGPIPSQDHDKLKAAVLIDSQPLDLVTIWEKGGSDLSKERARSFTAAMHSHSVVPALGVANRVDFSSSKGFLDVAGGSGIFALAVAERNPHIKAAILELPVVCEVFRETYLPASLESRVSTVSVDMFTESWPKDYDVHFFSNTFHDWDRNQCVHLAKKSYEALPIGGKIVLHEMLLNDHKDGGLVAASFSLHMLMHTKGKQFSAHELEEILAEAGFVDAHTVVTHDFYSVLIGFKK